VPRISRAAKEPPWPDNLKDSVTLAAGSNVRIISRGNTLTIAAAGAGGSPRHLESQRRKQLTTTQKVRFYRALLLS